MYLAALRLDDSIYNADGFISASNSTLEGDSLFFNFVYYVNQQYFGTGATTMYTVFAPTNNAFAAAGFNSIADLRAYAERSYVGPGINYGPFSFTALDSVLNQHLIGNSGYSFTNLSLYNDLLFNPDINSGVFNVFSPFTTNNGFMYGPAVHDQFLNKSNTVYIQWSDSSQVPPALLPADKSRHFMAQNGVVYETDQLFYPHN
jgi:hypothetical protein